MCVLYDVSIIELVARPEKFHGKSVAVHGFLNLEFEGNGLYLHEEDFKHSLYRNGLWMNVPRGWVDATKCKNQSYVLIHGVFNAMNTGHMGLWSGALESVVECIPWQ
jgi:hypothetical protein